MENVEDILEELRRRRRNIRYRELEKMLRRLGFEMRRSKKGTSHRVFSHPSLSQNITLVSHGKNDVIPIYQVKDVIKALEELGKQSP